MPYLRTWYFSDDIPELVEDFTPPPLFHSTDAFGRLPEDLQPPFRWQTFCKTCLEDKIAQLYGIWNFPCTGSIEANFKLYCIVFNCLSIIV